MVFSAQTFAELPADIASRFLENSGGDQSDAAVEKLFEGSGFADRKPLDMAALKGQLKEIKKIYGQDFGVELVEDIELSPSLRRLIYIQKFNDSPVVWRFYFYKPKDRWMITSLNFQEQVSEVLDSVRKWCRFLSLIKTITKYFL